MTEPKIIRIDPLPRQFSVTWMLGSRCNYDCMYCPAELHDKISKHHDIETLKQFWQEIVDKTKHLDLDYKISFTGGEVTTNRDFLPFLEWVKTTPYRTRFFVTSNGSAGPRYYRRLASVVDGISFSTHSEFMDEKRFFEIALDINKIMVGPEKSFHINIMNEHWNQDRIKIYTQFCAQNNISHTVNPIDYSHQTRKKIRLEGKTNLKYVF